MKPCVFIQTNHRQLVGALVSQHSLRSRSAHPDRFDVRIMQVRDHPFILEREGQLYLRDGARRPWLCDDLQSFTPLRFLPPELMGYQGRALVIDPDVFAAGDVMELLDRDMRGKAILCRSRSGAKGRAGIMASSVMLLDCAKLRHWRTASDFAELFAFQRDYQDWIGLRLEPPDTIGPLEPEWNDFDHLTPATRLLHNTKRLTQPWKTGLPVDFTPAEHTRSFPPLGWLRRARRTLLGPYTWVGHYHRHPDPAQERFFFGLLREAVERGAVSEALLREEMCHNHLRHDALELIGRGSSAAA
jgi:hypothetical protein